MNSRIFISYRREDSGGSTGRIFDRLVEHFASGQIFMDVEAIEPGLDFVEVIEKAVGSCDVLLAIIGDTWLTTADARKQRRLDNPEDFVRNEIRVALERNIRVIPVLVEGASMPSSDDLPEVLKPLARRNAIEISHVRFNVDMDSLIRVLDQSLEPKNKREPARKVKDISNKDRSIPSVSINKVKPFILPLIFWFSFFAYMFFTISLISSTSEDRTAGWMFLFNGVVMAIGGMSSHVGSIKRSTVCAIGGLIQIGIMIVMLFLEIGDWEIVATLNSAIAIALGVMWFFFKKEENA